MSALIMPSFSLMDTQSTRDPVAAQQAAERAAQNAEAALRNAEQAAEDASRAAENAVNGPAIGQEGAPAGNGNQTFTVPDGNGGNTRISIGTNGIQIGGPEGTPMTTVPINKVIPEGVVQITTGFFSMIVLVVIGGPIARAFARRMDRKTAASVATVPAEVSQRLAAIEQAVETVAVEVERISEGQRFTAKLLADRATVPAERRA